MTSRHIGPWFLSSPILTTPRCHKHNLNSIHTRAFVLVISLGTGHLNAHPLISDCPLIWATIWAKNPSSNFHALSKKKNLLSPSARYHFLMTPIKPSSQKSNISTYQILRETKHLQALFKGHSQTLKAHVETYILESSDYKTMDREHHSPEVSFLTELSAHFLLHPFFCTQHWSSKFLKLPTCIWLCHWLPLWKDYF